MDDVDVLIIVASSLILFLSIYQFIRNKFIYKDLSNIGTAMFGIIVIFARPSFKEDYNGLFYFFLVTFLILLIASIIGYFYKPGNSK